MWPQQRVRGKEGGDKGRERVKQMEQDLVGHEEDLDFAQSEGLLKAREDFWKRRNVT